VSEAAPGRPSERGARERILAAAVERIAGDGIDDMRIARVAMDAGVSTSLVHYHFETREALLAEALEYSYELAGMARLGEGEEHADPPRRLLDMIDHCLPYPGLLRQDWVLWVELWLRAVRHPELQPTAARLYERMRDWLAEGIAACDEDGTRDHAELADRLLAMCDGFGVRVLIGEMDIEYAREQVWDFAAGEIGLDRGAVRG
jgi:AcrR family transcriptional regulator